LQKQVSKLKLTEKQAQHVLARKFKKTKNQQEI